MTTYRRPDARFTRTADARERDVAVLLDADVVVIPPEGDEVAEIVARATGARVVYAE